VILLKGDFAIRRFSDFVERFEREVKPQKGSPLDSLFIM
jgi:two-component system response regulator YesN